MRKENQNVYDLLIVGFPATDRCNLSCKHCLSRINDNIKKSPDLEPHVAEYLASEFSGHVKYINLSAGYGETYLNRNISQILDIFRNYKIKTITYTNGSDASRQGVLKSYTNMLLISIDEYHSPVGSLIFDQQCSLIYNINVIGDQNIADKIVLTCTLDSKVFNSEYINAIKSLCDKYYFISAEFHWRMEYCDTDKNLYDDRALEKYMECFTSMKDERISPPTFLCYKDNQCSDIYNSLYFDSLGNLRKCCIFPDTFKGLNIFQQGLKGILNSKNLKDIQKYWKENKGYSFCKNCPIGFGVV